jgi:uncharacterized protein YdeI (YjbR/CyaY-like superfamily)
MSNMIRDPSEYFSRGCGRCPLFDTPRCKAKRWALPLAALRKIIRSTGLDEEAKWGVPVYTDRGKNILILSALKDLVSVGFLKGVLMSDPAQVLEKPGPNSHIDRVLRFRDMKRIDELEETLRDHIREAVEIERSGRKIPPRPPSDLEVPEEFQSVLDGDPAISTAFYALTPGRQKGYLLYFAGAKQSVTRSSRVEKCIPKILDGIGLHDRFD